MTVATTLPTMNVGDYCEARLAGPVALTVANQAFLCPTTQLWIVRQIILTNTAATDATVNVGVDSGAGSINNRIVSGLLVPAHSTVTVELALNVYGTSIAPNISAQASAVGVTMIVSGVVKRLS